MSSRMLAQESTPQKDNTGRKAIDYSDAHSDGANILQLPGRRADLVFTRDDYFALCNHMLNGNGPTNFLHVYRDDLGSPRFSRAKKPLLKRRLEWAWQTVTGRAKKPLGIGFYAGNGDGTSRWGAFDVDAHDGDKQRAQKMVESLHRVAGNRPDVYLLLTSSGNGGWHLFLFGDEFRPIQEWTRYLKQIAAEADVGLTPGHCEIFPDDVRAGFWPKAIRAPGTWNPKTEQIGAIYYSSLEPLLKRIGEGKRVSTFLYRSTDSPRSIDVSDIALYSGGKADWRKRFAITALHTRHAQVKALVFEMYRQVGFRIGRANAHRQFLESRVTMEASLDDHLGEFDQLWEWTKNRWLEEVPEILKELHERLPEGIERDLLRIVSNFAEYARRNGETDFPLSLASLAARLGVSVQYASMLRKRWIGGQLLSQTKGAGHGRSARFMLLKEKPVFFNGAPIAQ